MRSYGAILADYADSKSIENYYKNSTYKSSLVYPFNYTLRSDVLDEKDEEKIEYGIVYDKEAGADVTILYGNFPQEANEIALPYYLALFMSQKIKDYMTDNVKDLIGKDFIYRGLYNFKIVGIFDEGRYVDDFDQLSDADEKYIKQINFMARSVFFGEGVEKVLNNNDVIFYPYAPAETYKCLYNEKQVKYVWVMIITLFTAKIILNYKKAKYILTGLLQGKKDWKQATAYR